MITPRPPIYGPPNNNSRNAPAAPVEGIDGRLYCPGRNADGTICRASLHKTRTPPVCPQCLQPLWIEAGMEPRGHVTEKDLEQAGVRK